jgi:hypothetical protein
MGHEEFMANHKLIKIIQRNYSKEVTWRKSCKWNVNAKTEK